uniref:Uncharacterized protein n=1 Tax=Pyramimonas obovata TaxID=1411642 RepID=A0A7S0N7T3_9CHLO|mmetsp:Transcript_21197/g.46500  ORF Transcript_21197/g.46500 Transcript_21197/m.46500 type:complete len:230 (+) Transcript_21197:747-1436(+)|eukprot:CAMPEP_0118934952 /NCGR_PEP_ID=MMETSP1169-20130426/14580_1 /TAXON_ID=36882 /ORGANISM="Pyramimonas obovata, Strain CCMP722" /LENGTH=229 /DNA_ID=CAMNT_0006877917 /DNA_START=735 /DNA_END=1424 /DNA_ORIENTATION=+
MYAKLRAAISASARADEELHSTEDARPSIPSSEQNHATEPASQHQPATSRLHTFASQQEHAAPTTGSHLSSVTSGPRKVSLREKLASLDVPSRAPLEEEPPLKTASPGTLPKHHRVEEAHQSAMPSPPRSAPRQVSESDRVAKSSWREDEPRWADETAEGGAATGADPSVEDILAGMMGAAPPPRPTRRFATAAAAPPRGDSCYPGRCLALPTAFPVDGEWFRRAVVPV